MENKMYHFNPHDYGQAYFVMANSKEQALELVANSKEYYAEKFIGVTVDNLPFKYTIDEIPFGKVIRMEIC